MSIDRIILGTARLAVRLFYSVSVAGPSPPSGPLVLVGNHPNGLVDPVLLSCATPRPLRFLGKAPLFRIPLVGVLVRGARVLPVHRPQDGVGTDNEATFSAVYDALAGGDAIALFPEGKSHSEPKLQRMKTGAARMALGAEARSAFSLGVRVVPVGLVYRARRRFGSSAVVWVGPPIELDDLAALHEQDPWAAVEALTERIHAGLSELTLELERWEELPLLEFLADLEAAPRTAKFADIRQLAHELALARDRWPDEVIELGLEAQQLERRIAAAGSRPSDLERSYTALGVVRYVAKQLGLALLLLPLALLGRVAWFLPWQAIALLVRTTRPSIDVWATTAVLAGLVLFPLWVGFLGGICWFQFGFSFGVLAAAGLVLAGIAALASRGFTGGLARDVRAFFRRKAGVRTVLREQRDDLVKRVTAVRTRLAAVP